MSSLARHKLGEILVLRGHITTSELKYALRIQKQTKRQLGQILIDARIISRFQLTNVLLGQKALRYCAALMLYFTSFGSLIKTASAQGIKDVPARLSLASLDVDAIQYTNFQPSVFGANEKRSTNLSAFTKWTQMFDRFDKDLNKRSSNAIINGLKSELAEYKSSSIYNMARQVNEMMNRTKYISDSKNWGKSDYWATPIEFLTRGGDCEDFAIAKYVALRALGVPENLMRIAIVQDEQKNIPHAILIIYSERGSFVLDNQIKQMRSTQSIAHYKPIFSINRHAWWLHSKPSPTKTIVASAR